MRAPLAASKRAWGIAQDFPEELFNPLSAQFTENCSKATARVSMTDYKYPQDKETTSMIQYFSAERGLAIEPVHPPPHTKTTPTALYCTENAQHSQKIAKLWCFYIALRPP